MRQMTFCTAFVSLYQIPVSGWSHGFVQFEPTHDAISRQRKNVDG